MNADRAKLQFGELLLKKRELEAQLSRATAEIAALKLALAAAKRIRLFYAAHSLCPPDAFFDFDAAMAKLKETAE